jgi:site-specific DNA-methyltransferase (adenine-specific)
MGLKDLVWEKQRFETKEVGHGNLGATMEKFDTKGKNNHPTVKPIKLMEYLVRLVTPKEGIVLEPFAGSGTTLIACKQQGFNYIGIEREQEYCDIAEARLKAVQVQGELF